MTYNQHGFLYYFIIALILCCLIVLAVTFIFKVEPLFSTASGLVGMQTLPSIDTTAINPIVGAIGDAYNSNPLGFIAGMTTIAGVVGTPVYKWLDARSKNNILQQQASDIQSTANSAITGVVKELDNEKSVVLDLKKKIETLESSTLPQQFTDLQTKFDLKVQEASRLRGDLDYLQRLKTVTPKDFEQMLKDSKKIGQ